MAHINTAARKKKNSGGGGWRGAEVKVVIGRHGRHGGRWWQSRLGWQAAVEPAVQANHMPKVKLSCLVSCKEGPKGMCASARAKGTVCPTNLKRNV